MAPIITKHFGEGVIMIFCTTSWPLRPYQKMRDCKAVPEHPFNKAWYRASKLQLALKWIYILHQSCFDHFKPHSILLFITLITLYYIFFTHQAVSHHKPWDSCTWEWASACPVVVPVPVQELGRTETASYSPTENNTRYTKNIKYQAVFLHTGDSRGKLYQHSCMVSAFMQGELSAP